MVIGEGKEHKNYTAGLATTAAGGKYPPLLLVFNGVMQELDPMVEVEIGAGGGRKEKQ